jgi:hypothetical protein
MKRNLVVGMTDKATLQFNLAEVEFIGIEEVLFENDTISKSRLITKIPIYENDIILPATLKK